MPYICFFKDDDEVLIHSSKLEEYPDSLFSLMYKWNNSLERIHVLYIDSNDLYKIKFFYESGYWYNPRSYDRMFDIVVEGEIIEDPCDYLGLPFTLKEYEFDSNDTDDLEEVRGYIGKFYLNDYYEEEYLDNFEDEYREESSDSDYF